MIQLDSSLTKEAQNYLLKAVMEQSIELDSELRSVLASINFAGAENREVDKWNEFAKFVAGIEYAEKVRKEEDDEKEKRAKDSKLFI